MDWDFMERETITMQLTRFLFHGSFFEQVVAYNTTRPEVQKQS
jgi:hypothetical protein